MGKLPMIIQKSIHVLFIMLLVICYVGNSLALSYDDLSIGMDFQEIQPLLKDFDVQESETKSRIVAKKADQEITISFIENKATRIEYETYGIQESNIDLFTPDWTLTVDEIVDMLNGKGLEYKYRVNELTRKGEKKQTQHISFYGSMDSIPVSYSLRFDQKGNLEKIFIYENSRKEDMPLSNMFSFMAYTGEMLGQPDKTEITDYKSLSEENGVISYYDSCYWLQNGVHYQLEIETIIEQNYGGDAEPSINDYSRSASITISPVDE